MAKLIRLLALFATASCVVHQLVAQEDTDSDDELVAELVANSMGNMDSFEFSCEYELVIGIAENEEQLQSGDFAEILGEASGRWVRTDEREIYEFFIKDMKLIPGEETERGSKTLIAPFHGSESVLIDDGVVLKISHTMAQGEIGNAAGFHAEKLFSPDQAMGAVGADRWLNPLMFFIDPPKEYRHRVSESDGIAKVSSESLDDKLTTVIDSNKNFLLTNFAWTQDEKANRYFVSEARNLAGDIYIPKVTHIVFGDQDKFPKRTARWRVTRVSNIVDDSELSLAPLKTKVTVFDHEDPEKTAGIPANSIISLNDLSKIFAAVKDQSELLDLPIGQLNFESRTPAVDPQSDVSASSPNKFNFVFILCCCLAVGLIFVSVYRRYSEK